MEDAHGFVEHWDEPLLGRELEDMYRPPERGVLMQINCNICHRYDRSTPGADYINYAKELVRKKGCRACHKINGRGGVIGPDLTYEGDKSPEQFDYSRIGGRKSIFSWHVAHFKNPRMISPGTVMPEMRFSSKEAIALTMLVLSWRKVDLPPEYYPQSREALVDLPTPEELEKERQMREGEGAFFVEKGCFVCHSISVFGIESPAQIGPDLSQAVEDVPRRFGKTLENFINEPTGTMALVLGNQVVLSDSEKVIVVELLKKAYEKYRKKQSVLR
jgi:cytochrome c2